MLLLLSNKLFRENIIVSFSKRTTKVYNYILENIINFNCVYRYLRIATKQLAFRYEMITNNIQLDLMKRDLNLFDNLHRCSILTQLINAYCYTICRLSRAVHENNYYFHLKFSDYTCVKNSYDVDIFGLIDFAQTRYNHRKKMFKQNKK